MGVLHVDDTRILWLPLSVVLMLRSSSSSDISSDVIDDVMGVTLTTVYLFGTRLNSFISNLLVLTKAGSDTRDDELLRVGVHFVGGTPPRLLRKRNDCIVSRLVID